MLTDTQIEDAKKKVKYSLADGGHHEHPDCIRMAYEWLDAQKKTKQPSKKRKAIKHYVEGWAGRYVSTSDVEVAAFLHPDIKGVYPFYNISNKFTLPDESRLSNIGEAHKHSYQLDLDDYASRE